MKKKISILMFVLLISFLFVAPVYAATYNNYETTTVSCGSGLIEEMPAAIPRAISIIYTIIQVAVPIVLVILGSLDFFKSITSQKEDEIKKNQSMFIKRLISAAIVFFVFAIVKIVISVAADNSTSDIMDCAECFLKEKCNNVGSSSNGGAKNTSDAKEK